MTSITRLVGVYDADGTLTGEAAYWIGARLGRRHCALCDITHSPFRERSDWKACRDGLPVPFATVHRDEMPATVADLTEPAPFVAAETDSGRTEVLLGESAIAACGDDPAALMAAIEAAAVDRGLGWPTGAS